MTFLNQTINRRRKEEKKAGSCGIKSDISKKKKKKEGKKKRQRKKKKKENGAIKNQIDLLQASCIVIHFLIFKKGLRKKETR